MGYRLEDEQDSPANPDSTHLENIVAHTLLAQDRSVSTTSADNEISGGAKDYWGTTTTGYTPGTTATKEQFADYLINGYWQDSGRIAHSWADSNISFSIDSGFSAANANGIRAALQQWAQVTNVTFTEVGSNADVTFLEGDDGGAWSSTPYWWPSGDISESTISIDTNVYGWDDLHTLGDYGFKTVIHEMGHTLGLGHPGNYNGNAEYSSHALFANDTRQYSLMSYFQAANSNADHIGPDWYEYASTPLLFDIYAIQQIYGANTSTRAGDTVYGFNSTAGLPQFDFSLTPFPVLCIWDGGGNDTLDLSGFSANQLIRLGEGEFSNVGSGMTGNLSIAYGAVIENAVGGSGNDTIYGNATGNILRGGLGDDTFYGSAGDDTLNGEGGSDLVIYSYDLSAFVGRLINSFTVSLTHTTLNFVDLVENVENFLFNGSFYAFADLGDLFRKDPFKLTVRYEGQKYYANVDADYEGSVTTASLGISGTTVTYYVAAAEGDSLTLTVHASAPDRLDLRGTMEANTILVDGTHAGITKDIRVFDGDDVVTSTAAGSDYIYGGNGNDTLRGGAGDDFLYGEAGEDALYGEDGNDLLRGGDLADNLYGGNHNDTLYGELGDDYLEGNAGNDYLYGGDGADTLLGGTGNDRLYGDDGIDILHGDEGNDLLRGGSGQDELYGGDGRDTIFGDADDDHIEGGLEIDYLYGGLGNDALFGGDGDDVMMGEDGDDVLQGEAGDDRMRGGTGNDTLVGGTNRDVLFGEDGDDILSGGTDNDTLYGGNDADTLNGDEGNDYLYGESGDDILDGGLGADQLYGGDGIDTARYLSATHGIDVSLAAGWARDDGHGNGEKIRDVENVVGTAFNDEIYGDDGDNVLQGNGGEDYIVGNGGDDVLSGGNGNDILAGDAGNDQIDGGAGDDGLHGGLGDDILNGGEGNDLLRGGDGTDTLNGGTETDYLYGEGGSDIFVLATLEGGIDQIMDFRLSGPEADALDISSLLTGFDGLDNIDDFVQFSFVHATRTDLRINADGSGNDWVTAAIIRGADFSGVNASDLYTDGLSGQLITNLA